MKSIFAFVGVLAGFLLTGCGEKSSPATQSSAGETVTSSNSPVTAIASKPKHAALIGKWERADGGYVLEIRGVDSEGKLDAAYFNPAPIKVSQALAYAEGGTSKVMVELRDVNYPGCMYNLTYDAQSDSLIGQYFQAAVKETYDVAFQRQK